MLCWPFIEAFQDKQLANLPAWPLVSTIEPEQLPEGSGLSQQEVPIAGSRLKLGLAAGCND
jgi:hypothetical protein